MMYEREELATADHVHMYQMLSRGGSDFVKISCHEVVILVKAVLVTHLKSGNTKPLLNRTSCYLLFQFNL